MSRTSSHCPNCGNDPLESSQNVDVRLSDGVTVKAYLCGECGVIYVHEPNETARTERARAEKEARESDGWARPPPESEARRPW